jgi:hypothetical protein
MNRMKQIEGLWALNTKRGTTIKNSDIGEMPGGVAVPIDERQSKIAKNLHGVVIMDGVQLQEHKKIDEVSKHGSITE